MPKLIAMALVWVGLALTAVQAHAQGPRDLIDKRVTAHVTRIIDGDTVDVVIRPSRRIRVRFHGADAPEREEPFYQQAVVFTRVFMFSRDVTIVGKDVDPYNRLVARIVVDGKDASESLIGAGLGCTFHRYISDPALDAALTRAQGARLGFWANGARRPRCVEREARQRTSQRGSREDEAAITQHMAPATKK